MTMIINKEVLVYSSQPFTKYRWIGFMSTIQIGFVLLSVSLMPTQKLIDERRLASERNKKEEVECSLSNRSSSQDYVSLWEKLKRAQYNEIITYNNVRDNMVDRPYIFFGLIGASIAISSAFFIYARRIAHKITLLPKDRIRFESFTPFAIGAPPKTELPLRNVSCVSGRRSQTNYSILKFKGYRGYHLVHKTDGRFLEPKLYDEYLGFKRSWDKSGS